VYCMRSMQFLDQPCARTKTKRAGNVAEIIGLRIFLLPFMALFKARLRGRGRGCAAAVSVAPTGLWLLAAEPKAGYRKPAAVSSKGLNLETELSRGAAASGYWRLARGGAWQGGLCPA